MGSSQGTRAGRGTCEDCETCHHQRVGRDKVLASCYCYCLELGTYKVSSFKFNVDVTNYNLNLKK